MAGVFPTKFKVAVVIPIIEKLSKLDCNNNSPIPLHSNCITIEAIITICYKIIKVLINFFVSLQLSLGFFLSLVPG